MDLPVRHGTMLSGPRRSNGNARQSRISRDLGHCLGYTVDGPSGRIGTVVGVLVGSSADSPDALEVRVGLYNRRVIVVPVGAVAAVRRSSTRVTLARDIGALAHSRERSSSRLDVDVLQTTARKDPK
jgi:hypothetical protein